MIWQEERTLIVFISERLKSGQIRGIYQFLEKAEKQLRELQEALCKPKARRRDKEQLEAKITNTVKGQFVKNVIDWSLQEVSKGRFRLDFTINQGKLGEIEERLGIRILMTDRHDWSTVEIIKAYYGQSMIEHAFKNLKNPYHLALRPQYHWTDQKIKVHFFICVLGYLLATILEDSKTRGSVKATYRLEEISDEEASIVDALEITDTHNNRLKFNGVGVYN